MIKLTFLIIFVVAFGVVFIRSRWARSKNSNEARRIIGDLQSGKHSIESYEEAMPALITTIPLDQLPDEKAVRIRFQAISGKSIHSKFSIQYGDINAIGKGLVLGEAISKEVVTGYTSDREMDIHFPCWLFFRYNVPEKKLEFRSVFPESKDHHYLLEDFARLVFDKAIRS